MSKKATRDHFGEYLIKLGEKHKNVIVTGCDLAIATRSIDFKKKFQIDISNVAFLRQMLFQFLQVFF